MSGKFEITSSSLLRNFKRQQCAICRCQEKFNFQVPDNLWERVVPEEHRARVICLSCFDNFAQAKNIPYSQNITDLLFVGDKAAVAFETKSATDL